MRQKETIYWFGLLASSSALMCGIAAMSYGLTMGEWSLKFSISRWPIFKLSLILTTLTHLFAYFMAVAKRFYGVSSGVGPMFVMLVTLFLGLIFPMDLIASWDKYVILTTIFAVSGLHYLGALLIEEEILRKTALK